MQIGFYYTSYFLTCDKGLGGNVMSYYQPYRQNPYYGATGPMQQAVYPQQQQQFPQMPMVAPQLAQGLQAVECFQSNNPISKIFFG